MTTFDLRTLKLRSGEQFRDTRDVELEPLELGGQRYLPVPQKPASVLTVSRASSGYVFELELDARLLGPCVRCLADAGLSTLVRAREYQAARRETEDELQTPYVVDDTLDLAAWARDAIALSIPEKILCRPDCAGLCPLCGLDLNREAHEHDDEDVDPRWAGLAELRDRL